MATTRRSFLAQLAAMGATVAGFGNKLRSAFGMSNRIARVDAYPVVYPVHGYFKFFEAPRGRKPGRPAVVVRIITESGATGWGQSVPVNRWSYETLETAYTTIKNYLGPELIGRDPFDVEAIHAAMNSVIAPGFSTGQPIAKAGIDLALYDLMGRISQKPFYERFGGLSRKKLVLSWTLNPRTLDEIEPLMEEGRSRGYRHFNVKVGPDPKFDVEMCRIVRRLAPDCFLWADANGGYDVETALQVAPKLADVGVAVLEQPVRPNRLSGLKRLKQQGALPIILDEGVISTVELREFIQLGILDGVAMKPARTAGLTEASKMIELLLDEGLMFLGSGLTDPDLSLAASLGLYGAYDLQYPAALNGPQFLTTSILREPFRVVDGYIDVPTGPGLGVEVDPERLHQHIVEI